MIKNSQSGYSVFVRQWFLIFLSPFPGSHCANFRLHVFLLTLASHTGRIVHYLSFVICLFRFACCPSVHSCCSMYQSFLSKTEYCLFVYINIYHICFSSFFLSFFRLVFQDRVSLCGFGTCPVFLLYYRPG